MSDHAQATLKKHENKQIAKCKILSVYCKNYVSAFLTGK